MSKDNVIRKIAKFPLPNKDDRDVIRTILLDDNHVDREVIRRLTGEAGVELEIHEVTTLKDFQKAVETRVFDLAFIDFMLTDGNGLEALTAIKQSALNTSAGIVMIANQAEVQIAVTALKHGCSDFVVKDDLTPATLRRSIHNALKRATLHRQVDAAGAVLQRMQQALRYQANRSVSEVRPLVERTLREVAAMTESGTEDMSSPTDARLSVMEVACRNMLLFCDEVERLERTIAKEVLSTA